MSLTFGITVALFEVSAILIANVLNFSYVTFEEVYVIASFADLNTNSFVSPYVSENTELGVSCDIKT